MNAGEHGPDELYDKFRVFRTKTGEELTRRGEFILVLRPETNDRAAQEAILRYADVAEETYPEFADQLRLQVDQIRRRAANTAVERSTSLSEAYRHISDNRPPAPQTLPEEYLQ